MSPYEILGVGVDASTEEIHRAYLQLARRHHPDQFASSPGPVRNEAEQRMREINLAWSELGDATRRARLDDARPRTFTPFSPDRDDEPDPRDAPDVPYRPVRPPSVTTRALTMGPVLLFAAATGVGGLGVVVSFAPLIAMGAVLFVLSCLGFVVAPLVALGNARQDEG